jgi:sugar phosphate permease
MSSVNPLDHAMRSYGGRRGFGGRNLAFRSSSVRAMGHQILQASEVTSSSNWFSSMSARERSTFWACFFGWVLDAMDVQIYAVVMPTLITLWSLTKGQAGMLGTSALLVSSLGGWIAGILADRIGRAKVLKITIIWFAAFTFLSGFTNSYYQLLLTRSLQGLGFGGEWAAGAVLMSEVIDKRVRGRAVGSVQIDILAAFEEMQRVRS